MILCSDLCPSERCPESAEGRTALVTARSAIDARQRSTHTAWARLVDTAQRAEEAHVRGMIGSITCEG